MTHNLFNDILQTQQGPSNRCSKFQLRTVRCSQYSTCPTCLLFAVQLSHRSLFWRFVRSLVDPETSIWTQFWFKVAMQITHYDLVGKVKSLKKSGYGFSGFILVTSKTPNRSHLRLINDKLNSQRLGSIWLNDSTRQKKSKTSNNHLAKVHLRRVLMT